MVENLDAILAISDELISNFSPIMMADSDAINKKSNNINFS